MIYKITLNTLGAPKFKKGYSFEVCNAIKPSY